MNLKGKAVLVTGSSRSLGKAIALAFAKESCNIIVNYNKSKDKAEQTVNEIKKYNVAAISVKADVSNQNEVREMFKTIKSEFGKLDILVNNAGYTKLISHKNLEELDEETFDKVINTNLKGAFFCVREAVKLMDEGLIINIASTGGITGRGSNIAYCASKAGLITMTRSLTRALGPKIRVNAIAPGLMMTALTKEWKEMHAKTIKETPSGKETTPEDVAKKSIEIAKKDSINGECFIVDEGRFKSSNFLKSEYSF